MDLSYVVVDLNQLKSIWYEGVSHLDVVKNCPHSMRYTTAVIDYNTGKMYEYTSYINGDIKLGKQIN